MSESKASERPVYNLLLRPEPGVPDAERALRQALKALLRRFKLRCVAIEQVQKP